MTNEEVLAESLKIVHGELKEIQRSATDGKVMGMAGATAQHVRRVLVATGHTSSPVDRLAEAMIEVADTVGTKEFPHLLSVAFLAMGISSLEAGKSASRFQQMFHLWTNGELS